MQLYSWKIIASYMNLSLLIFSLFSVLFSFFIATLFLYLTLYLCIFDKPVALAMPINSPSTSMMLLNRNFFASKQRRNFFVSQFRHNSLCNLANPFEDNFMNLNLLLLLLLKFPQPKQPKDIYIRMNE